MGTEFDFSPEVAQRKQAVYRQIARLQGRATPRQFDAIENLLDGGTSLEDILRLAEGWDIPKDRPARKILPKTGHCYKRRGLRSIILNNRAKALPPLPHAMPDMADAGLPGANAASDVRLSLLEEERINRVHSRLAQGLPLRETDRIPRK
jgi:hypothetical protein